MNKTSKLLGLFLAAAASLVSGCGGTDDASALANDDEDNNGVESTWEEYTGNDRDNDGENCVRDENGVLYCRYSPASHMWINRMGMPLDSYGYSKPKTGGRTMDVSKLSESKASALHIGSGAKAGLGSAGHGAGS